MTKKFRKSKKTFISILLSFVFVACLIVANYLSSLIIPAEANSESITSSSFQLHFLALAKSQIENEAIAHAPDYRSIGAGGFVWKDNEYHYIVSSAYGNKNDADLVQINLKQTQNIESEIVSVTFESITITGNFSTEEKKIVSRALAASQTYYNSIYDIAISLDTGVYNEISAKLAVNSAHNTLATTYADFSTIYEGTIVEPLKKISLLLQTASKVSQKLCTGEKISENQTYSSLLKYRYMQVLKIYKDFLSKFN